LSKLIHKMIYSKIHLLISLDILLILNLSLFARAKKKMIGSKS